MGATPGVDRRFAQHGNLQRADTRDAGGNFGAQALAHFALEQSFQFVRRARQQHNDVLAAVELSAQPLSGRGAVRIRKHCGAVENVGLLRVVGRHLPAALGEALLQTREDFRITAQAQAQSFGHGLSRQIVFGGAEARR